MAFNYPNGRPFVDSARPQKAVAQSHSKRGMTLETDLNEANAYYLVTDQAVIHKKPTPIQIVHVDYPARAAAKISEAYFRQPSTTDYNGLYRGQYIDFDAKETTNQQSFPLKNVHEHQVTHLKKIVAQGGLAFMVIRFAARQETFVIWAQLLFDFWQGQVDGRKSIPYEEIVKHGARVPLGITPTLPYLKAVDELLARRGKE
jgi:recombination protein U